MKSTLMKLGSLGLALVIVATAVLLPGPQVAKADANFGGPWQGYYWNNNNFSGNPTVSRTDTAINFNWGAGSPDPAIPADNFSARWYGSYTFTAGTYTFKAGAEDGIRVAIDGTVVIDRFSASSIFQVITKNITLGAGSHNIIVDFFAGTGLAGVQFSWDVAGAAAPAAAAPTATPAPATSPNGIPASAIKVVVISDVANVRSGPGSSFPIIAQIFRDQQFAAVARSGNLGPRNWYLIQLQDGRRGWVFRPLLYFYNGDPASLPITGDTVQPQPAIADVQATANGTVIVRDGPSKRGTQKIGALNPGQSVKVLRLSINRAWILVDANGLQGWVFLPLMTIVSGDLGRVPVGN